MIVINNGHGRRWWFLIPISDILTTGAMMGGFLLGFFVMWFFVMWVFDHGAC